MALPHMLQDATATKSSQDGRYSRVCESITVKTGKEHCTVSLVIFSRENGSHQYGEGDTDQSRLW